MLPERPRSHEIETESRNFVRSSFPLSWIVEEVELDYGTDLRVEIVEDGQPTGLLFLVQVKGHEEMAIASGCAFEDFNVGHLEYYMRLVLPVFLVTYNCQKKSALCLSIKDYIDETLAKENPGWQYQKNARVRIPLNNDLQKSIQYIVGVVQLFFQKHGLWNAAKPITQAEKLSGSLITRIAKDYPARKAFAKLFRDTLDGLKVRNTDPLMLGKVKKFLENVAVFEEVNKELLVKLAEPNIKQLIIASRVMSEEELIALLDSPWCKSIDPHFRAFLLSIRITKSELPKKINSCHFQDLDLFFAILEELVVMNPNALQEIHGVSIESLIRSSGGSTVRSTSLRFLDPSMNQSYEEFCSRKRQQEWSEVVVTPKYHALVRLSSSTIVAKESKIISLEAKSRLSNVVVFGLESDMQRNVNLVDITVIRRNSAQVPALNLLYTRASTLDYRAGVLNSFVAVEHQNVNVQALSEVQGGIRGMRINVDGIPLLEVRLGLDAPRLSLPSDVSDLIQKSYPNSPYPETILLIAQTTLSNDEMALAKSEVVDALRKRYGNLNMSP